MKNQESFRRNQARSYRRKQEVGAGGTRNRVLKVQEETAIGPRRTMLGPGGTKLGAGGTCQ